MEKTFFGFERRKLLSRLMEAHIIFQIAAILIVIIFWAVLIQYVRIEKQHADREAVSNVRELGDVFESHMIRNLGFIDQTLKIVKYAYEQRGSANVLTELEKMEMLPPKLVFTVSIVNRKGDVVASTASGKRPSVAGQAFFHLHSRGDMSSPSVHLIKEPGQERKIQFSRRLNAPGGAFNGVAIISVDPEYFTSDYEQSKFGEKGLVGLVGTNGIYWSKRTGEQVIAGEPAFKTMVDLSVPEDEKNDLPELHFVDSVKRFATVKRIPRYPLALAVGLSVDEQMAAAKSKIEKYYWVGSIVSAVFAMIAIVVTRLLIQLNESRRRSRKNQETYYATSEASGDGIYVLRARQKRDGQGLDFVIDDLNNRGALIFGKSKAELVGTKICEQIPQIRDNGLLDAMVEVYLTGQKHESEWRRNIPSLNVEWLYREIMRVEDGVVVVIRDITDRKRTEERITHMAHHDALTGLPNRSLLNDRLQQTILRAKREHKHVTVAFLDLDNFKPINDTLGHRVGDVVLKAIANRMVKCVRQTDSIIRLGGDEFVIILGDQLSDSGALTPTLQRIRHAIAEPVYFEGNRLIVTSSVGLASYPKDGEDPSVLVLNADTAMYHAKENGRDRYEYYTSGMKMRGELAETEAVAKKAPDQNA